MNEQTLIRFNEWWSSGTIRPELTGSFRREDYNKLRDLLEGRQIVMIYGLRRVGKTTTMYQIISDLLKEGTSPNSILYFSFDESSADMDKVLDLFVKIAVRKPLLEIERAYIFLDEIQKARDWENKIKIYYDLYPHLKFVISGSSLLSMVDASSETLAGRIYRIRIEPLSFREFLKLRGYDIPFDRLLYSLDTLRPLFLDYIEKGGFPELVSEEDSWKMRNYIRSIVIDRIVNTDIPQEFAVQDLDLLKNLLELFLLNPGMILNVDKISSSLGRNRITVSNMIVYLERAFLIRTIGNFRPGRVAASRKLKKVYPYVPAFHISFLPTFGRYDEGRVFENAIISILPVQYYFRDGPTEIDFILNLDGNIIPMEVKSGNFDLKVVARAIRRLGQSSGIIISQGYPMTRSVEDIIISEYPIQMLAAYPSEVISDYTRTLNAQKT